MITPNEIAKRLQLISGVDVFKETRKREYVETRSLFNHILFAYKKMPLHQIVQLYNNNGWMIHHATLIYSIKTYDIHSRYNPRLKMWLKQIVVRLDEMDISTKKEYIKNRINLLTNQDIDELTHVVSYMQERVEYEKQV